ncbi:MAG: lysophospholipase [Deltaproteobacteria bacterium]|nr:lysophospholipase [Deltaproteobacteria bacterium]
MDNKYITTFDGKSIYFWFNLVSKPKNVILLVHGFAEYSERYKSLFEVLNAHGVSTFAFDLRGHGRSEGIRSYISKFEDYVADLSIIVDMVKEIVNQDKITLLGHSMGGLIASVYTSRFKNNLKSLVLSSPFFGLSIEISLFKRIIGNIASILLPSFSMPTGIKGELCTHDETIARSYDADPLINKYATARWFTEVMNAQKGIEDVARKIDIPVALFAAGEDRLVSLEAEKRFFEHIKSKDKYLKIFDGFYHEIFNEIKKDEVINELINWLDKH